MTQNENFNLLVGELSPFTFFDVNDMFGLNSVMVFYNNVYFICCTPFAIRCAFFIYLKNWGGTSGQDGGIECRR